MYRTGLIPSISQIHLPCPAQHLVNTRLFSGPRNAFGALLNIMHFPITSTLQHGPPSVAGAAIRTYTSMEQSTLPLTVQHACPLQRTRRALHLRDFPLRAITQDQLVHLLLRYYRLHTRRIRRRPIRRSVPQTMEILTHLLDSLLNLQPLSPCACPKDGLSTASAFHSCRAAVSTATQIPRHSPFHPLSMDDLRGTPLSTTRNFYRSPIIPAARWYKKSSSRRCLALNLDASQRMIYARRTAQGSTLTAR